jgi:molybdate transport system ATP-binding protein
MPEAPAPTVPHPNTPERASNVRAAAAPGGIEARFRVEHEGFSLDVDLDLPGRGVTAIFGHSGSGKTTVLRCVAGLARPSEGRLSVNGEVWLDTAKGIFMPTHQRPLGYVFQEASLFAHLSVARNLRYGLNRIAPAARKVDLAHAAGLLGIGHLLERMPAGLSGGERQRVAIARAFLADAPILVLDEATSSLDVETERQVQAAMEELMVGRTSIVIAHRLSTIRGADRILVFEDGRIVEEGKHVELVEKGGAYARLHAVTEGTA